MVIGLFHYLGVTVSSDLRYFKIDDNHNYKLGTECRVHSKGETLVYSV